MANIKSSAVTVEEDVLIVGQGAVDVSWGNDDEEAVPLTTTIEQKTISSTRSRRHLR